MKIDDLRAKCLESEYVVLHLPAPNSEGYTRRLCGKTGPRGEVLCGRPTTGQTVRFDSRAVLRYLHRLDGK